MKHVYPVGAVNKSNPIELTSINPVNEVVVAGVELLPKHINLLIPLRF